jgi:hypothetical protein
VCQPASADTSEPSWLLAAKGSAQDLEEVSVRLQVDESDTLEDLDDQQVPWSAGDLDQDTCVHCRQCGQDILTSAKDRGAIWKDLPGDDWAEMMDIWHCHKPDPPKNDHSDDLVAEFRDINHRNEKEKGYGAANRVLCFPGIVLIDIASFVFVESDCRGIKKVRSSFNTGGPRLFLPIAGRSSLPFIPLLAYLVHG